jgi:hypothetical protein
MKLCPSLGFLSNEYYKLTQSNNRTSSGRGNFERGTPTRYIERVETEKPQTRRSAKKSKHWEDLENMLFDYFNEDGTKFGNL